MERREAFAVRRAGGGPGGGGELVRVGTRDGRVVGGRARGHEGERVGGPVERVVGGRLRGEIRLGPEEGGERGEGAFAAAVRVGGEDGGTAEHRKGVLSSRV